MGSRVLALLWYEGHLTPLVYHRPGVRRLRGPQPGDSSGTSRWCSTGRSRLQWLHHRPRDWTLLCGEGRDCHKHREGSHSRVYTQGYRTVSLYLCHSVQAFTRGNLRGELREVLSDHIQTAGLQRDCEEVL